MNKVQHIIQGLYGISESEKMIPNKNARFTLNKTVECLETALEEHEKEIRNKTIEEFSEKIKTIYPFTLLELEELDKLIEEMRNVK